MQILLLFNQKGTQKFYILKDLLWYDQNIYFAVKVE